MNEYLNELKAMDVSQQDPKKLRDERISAFLRVQQVVVRLDKLWLVVLRAWQMNAQHKKNHPATDY